MPPSPAIFAPVRIKRLLTRTHQNNIANRWLSPYTLCMAREPVEPSVG